MLFLIFHSISVVLVNFLPTSVFPSACDILLSPLFCPPLMYKLTSILNLSLVGLLDSSASLHSTLSLSPIQSLHLFLHRNSLVIQFPISLFKRFSPFPPQNLLYNAIFLPFLFRTLNNTVLHFPFERFSFTSSDLITILNFSDPTDWECENKECGNKSGLGLTLLVVGCVVGAVVTGVTVAWAILHTWPSITQVFTSATQYSPGASVWVICKKQWIQAS